jgi:hypothetical protein
MWACSRKLEIWLSEDDVCTDMPSMTCLAGIVKLEVKFCLREALVTRVFTDTGHHQFP